jgi:PEP-CTERM/exosortase A-associated glycosyltransferase
LRILHILDHSVPMQSGYAFRTLGILEQQRRMGWETLHLTSPKHTQAGPPRESYGEFEFVRTAPVAAPWRGLPVIGELALMRNTYRALVAYAGESRPDILHAHSPVLNALPALAAGRRLGLPVVYEVRAFWEDAAVSHGTSASKGLRYRATRAVETFALRRADAVTTICEGLRRDIAARGIDAGKITVIPNAVNAAEFAGPKPPDPALQNRLGLAGATVLGFFGSFYHYEGLHILLRALPEIARRSPAVRVLLAGGGPEEAELRALAASLGVGERVKFVGRVPHADIGRYYDLVDIFVFPRVSIRLTELVTPLKPLEAMAQRRIVLASAVGGHRELISDGETGFLFPADDPAALAATVAAVLARRGDWPAMLDRARRFVETERSWAASAARYRGVYERLLLH